LLEAGYRCWKYLTTYEMMETKAKIKPPQVIRLDNHGCCGIFLLRNAA
jgi:hypothetical protein